MHIDEIAKAYTFKNGLKYDLQNLMDCMEVFKRLSEDNINKI
jgi:hypothetical protein